MKGADGRIELRQSRQLAAGDGIVGGGAVGLLLGLAVGIPVAAALIGLAGGGAAAALDRGISDGRMRRLAEESEPGHAILFALVTHAEWPLLRERLAGYGGELVVSAVDDEVAAALGLADAGSPDP